MSAVAAKVARHAAEQQQVLGDSLGRILASQARTASSSAGDRPVAMLEATSATDSGSTPELYIHPPVQEDRDVLMELDGVMAAEQAKRRLADEIFAGDKQRMLDVEKSELRRIIRNVFA